METSRQTRNKVNKLNIELKREFFINKIASQNGNLRSTLKTINTVLNKKSTTTQIAALEIDGRLISDSIAESINNVFHNIGNIRSGKIPETPNQPLENSTRLSHKI